MESRPYSWVALDPDCDHPLDEKEKDKKEERKCHCDVCCNGNGFFGNDNAFIDQNLAQANLNKQVSDETIIIRDSCDINVSSTDVQAVTSVVTAVNANCPNSSSHIHCRRSNCRISRTRFIAAFS